MAKTPLHVKSFRYRNGGVEKNHHVMVTAQNQNSLKGFDISDATDKQVAELQKVWNRYASRKMPLSQKESAVLKRVNASFKSFKTSKIRYYHEG